MDAQRLLNYYLPPAEGFLLESLVATTYQVDFEFFEEELLARALGVRSLVGGMRAFRSELERRLRTTDVTVLYDLAGCERLARLSPRIDALPVAGRKLHAKVSLLTWVRPDLDGASGASGASGRPPARRARLIVGSANLTRSGFRENYECVTAIDYGGRGGGPKSLWADAVDLVRRVGEGSGSPQLNRQLDHFDAVTASLPDSPPGPDDPVALVTADDAVARLRETWDALSEGPPAKLTVVSPFWPEGASAADALARLVERLGRPADVELVCRGAYTADAKRWLPEFDASTASNLREHIAGRLTLRAARPDFGVEDDAPATVDRDDEGEDGELAPRQANQESGDGDFQRALHAKMLLLDGSGGSVLYVGSSNATRRGLSLGGPTNREAGLIYRLTPRQRRQAESLLAFAGPPADVLPGRPPRTVAPRREEACTAPTFLSEVTAAGSEITIRFRAGEELPGDLLLLMPVPSRAGGEAFWLLHRREPGSGPLDEIRIDLRTCPACNERLESAPNPLETDSVPPHVYIEVHWDGQVATFPVRFDDKAALPLWLLGRKPTEGELIEYFLFDREPDESDEEAEGGNQAGNGRGPEADGPVDTRRILSYFMRQFVQAIPGIEAEVARAAYSPTALDAALRGPTSPLALAEGAFASLARPPAADDPEKTPTAVGFQLVEILAALLRCRMRLTDPELRACFDPVVTHCRELLDRLAGEHAVLRAAAFLDYRHRFTEVTP